MIEFINFICLLIQSLTKLFVNMAGCMVAYMVFMGLRQAIPVIIHKQPMLWEELNQMEKGEETWPEN